MTGWLKAGLIGGAALSALYLLNLIPLAGGVAVACCCIVVVAYVLICGGAGALTAQWLPAPRDSGKAAGQGALAGGLAGLIGGAVNAVVTLIQSASTDTAEVMALIPPEMLQSLKDAGVTPDMIEQMSGPLGGLGSGACCCAAGAIVALALGAIGGAIWAAARPNQ